MAALNFRPCEWRCIAVAAGMLAYEKPDQEANRDRLDQTLGKTMAKQLPLVEAGERKRRKVEKISVRNEALMMRWSRARVHHDN